MPVDVSVTAGPDKNTSKVVVGGSEQHVITNDERKTFNLEDSSLKKAVGAYFGKEPNDAYLSSPTPWGDLYKTYSWPQVQTVFVAESAEILAITSEPVIVKTQDFINSSSKKGVFNVSITESVQNTSSSTWSTSGTLTISRKINVGIEFLGIGGSAENTLSYSQSWGIGETKTLSVTIGSSSGVQVTLDPGESVTAVLSASRGSMKVRIRYRAYLIGSTAVNYNPTYKDHHFWALPIADVMKAGGISNENLSTQDMSIGYYSNSKVELKDKEGTVKASYKF